VLDAVAPAVVDDKVIVTVIANQHVSDVINAQGRVVEHFEAVPRADLEVALKWTATGWLVSEVNSSSGG
jgi:hypothetical protein